MNSRKKPGVAFWATVVVIVAILYVLSVGPASWLSRDGRCPAWINGKLPKALYQLVPVFSLL